MLVEVEKLKKNSSKYIVKDYAMWIFYYVQDCSKQQQQQSNDKEWNITCTMYFCLKTFKSSFIIRVLPVSILSQKEFWEVVMGTQHMPLSVPFPVDQFPAKMYCNNIYF